jgi:class 3 adenylate cyclase/tetratricopeptide (TPR) repeat protein
LSCSECGQANPPGAKFCTGCGARLEARCADCGHANALGSRFCGQCGTPLGAAVPSAGPERLQSPREYTPKHLAEKILTSRELLEGERKQVTVLFADMKGSMELILDRDPEEVRGVIDPVLDLMMDAVHRYEGTVNQLTGDGIMALFGAPLAHEDHAVRACYAALAMQDGIRHYNETLRREQGVEALIRIGLNSGEVVVRAVKTDLTMDYSAVGLTTHLAARMEQLAAPGTIRLAPETLKHAEGFIRVAPLGLVAIKGMPQAMEVFELIGASALRTRVQVAAARGLTPFIGRRQELDAMSGTLDRVRVGKGEIVSLVGEPGVGKSRLVWEFTHSHRTHDWLVLESGSVSYGRATAYRPVIDLIRGYFQVEDRDDVRRIQEKVTGKLLTLDKSLEATLPVFLALLDVPHDDTQWTGLHPSLRKERIFDACRRLLLRESMVQPLVLVFEDLHWIDSETQAFLDTMVEILRSARILLLVNYRPEYRHGWSSRPYYTQLHIAPLPAASADELLLRILGDDSSLEPLRHLLVRRTEGNPFFLEESVRDLVEAGILTGERQRYRLQVPVAEIQVPARVQSILAARIDRLAPAHKRLLQTAAVVGKDVPFTLLREVAGLPEEDLQEGLSHLHAAEFVYEASLYPDLEYTFTHALTHEVTYSGVLQERRRAIHARVVDSMETVYGSRIVEQVERIAIHAIHGELWDKAVQYLREAGGKALARSANAEAVAYLEQALSALRRLPESPEAMARAVDLIFEIRNALHPLGEFDRVLNVLREAERIAGVLNDQRRLGRVYSFLSQSLRISGNYIRAVETGRQAITSARQFDDIGTEATANFHVGQACFHCGDYAEAIALHQRNIEITAGELQTQRLGMAGLPSVFSRGHLAWCLAERGEFDAALSHWQEAMRIAAEANHPFSHAFAEYCGGFIYLRRGDLRQAITWLERGIAHCQSMNIRLELPFATAFLGCAYALTNRVEEGIVLAQQAVEAARAINLSSGEAWLLALLAETNLLAGRPAEARNHAMQGLELARARGEVSWEAWSLYFLGEAHAASTPPDATAAHETLGQAFTIAQRIGIKPLQGRCLLALGIQHRGAGAASQARAHLESARDLLAEMEMELWIGRALDELRAVAA